MFFLFCMQKTAYEMRISDWSSDVCSSDLKTMRPGAVLVDVAIDHGGCFETSHATTHADPTYIVEGIVHYAVANMPGAVARTSTYALNNVTLQIGSASCRERVCQYG